MNPMTHTWSAERNSPITAFEPADPCLPEHVAAAYNTPPKGYLRRRRDTHRRPDADGMFVTRIPASAADASTYIANMQFPYTRKRRVMQAIVDAQPPSTGFLYGFLAIMTGALITMLSTDPDTVPNTIGAGGFVLCIIVLVAFFMFVATAMLLETRMDTHHDKYCPVVPTKLMHTIHDRSIKVARVIPGLADKAWKVYLYDIEHYDEYAQLIADVVENPAEYGSKTYAVHQDILDTFWRASLLRQKAVQRDLDAQAERIAQQRADEKTQAQHQATITDEMRAGALETTVLDKLKADEAAARAIYGDNSDDSV